MNQEEIQIQFDDITTRLDDNDQSLSDFSDNVDNGFSDIQNTLDDNQTSIEDLQTNEGQLMFPLSQDTIDLIKEQFPTGKITLVGGIYTLIDPRISTNSIILMTYALFNGVSGTAIPCVLAGNGSAVFNGTDPGDVSTINYLIL